MAGGGLMAMESQGGRRPFFYSPEGRLLQVDYALQAVNRGSTTIGLKTKDFAVLSSHVKPTRSLLEPAEKVFVVDEHVGATGSGYIGDVNSLVDEIRLQAQRHRLVYDNAIEHGVVTRDSGKFVHQNGGKAPKPTGHRTK